MESSAIYAGSGDCLNPVAHKKPAVLERGPARGGLFTAPGEAVSIDLAAYLGESDAQVRWHYYDPSSDDWDWYAQVDNVGLTCILIPDCDGAVAPPDRLWPPNYKWHAIDVEVTDADGEPVTVTIDSIFQDSSRLVPFSLVRLLAPPPSELIV